MSFPSVPKDANQIPISSIYIPGVGFVALQGTNSSTDGSGNASAGVVAALYGKVTNPGDTPLLLDSSGRVLVGNITQIGGQAPQLDSTNKLGVSLYGKNSVAGDTTILLDASGRQIVNVNTMPAITGAVTTAQTDLTGSGTISAAQPVINTPVSNATVVLALGTGQSTWKAQLKDGGGGFTSGTTIVADKSIDGGITYFATSFKVSGASPSTPQSTVVGPGPLELTGMAAGATHIRIRCSVLNSTETIAVRINASSGVSEIGLMGSIPAGSNLMGSVTGNVASGVTDSGNPLKVGGIYNSSAPTFTNGQRGDAQLDVNGNLKVAVTNANTNGQTIMSASAPVAIASDQSKLPVKAASGDFATGAIVDLTTLIANTADLLADGDNLATIATNTTNASTPTTIQGAGAAAGTSWRVKGDFTEQASLTAGSLNADLVASVDVSAYKSFSIQVTGAWVGTLTFQGGNDNVNFSTVIFRASGNGNTESGTATANGLFVGDIGYRYLRVRMTSYTSGTANATLELYTQPLRYGNVATSIQSGTWTVQPGNTQNTTPWLVSQGPPADLTLIASAAFTTTQTVADQTNFAGKGLRVVLDMTTVGTGSVTLAIQAKDVASGKYVALLTGAAVTTNSTNVYVVYPGLTPAANAIVSDVLPHTWRVVVTANNANSATYSVGASYLT